MPATPMSSKCGESGENEMTVQSAIMIGGPPFFHHFATISTSQEHPTLYPLHVACLYRPISFEVLWPDGNKKVWDAKLKENGREDDDGGGDDGRRLMMDDRW